LKHGSGTVVRDAVSFKDVLGNNNFPCQPSLTEGRIKGQKVRKVTGLTAAKSCINNSNNYIYTATNMTLQ